MAVPVCHGTANATQGALDLLGNQSVLPDAKHPPTSVSETLCDEAVTGFVAAKLFPPKFGIAPGSATMLRAIMPETTVHKNRQF